MPWPPGTQEGILTTADLQALSAQPLTLLQIQPPQPADLVAAAAAPTPAEVVKHARQDRSQPPRRLSAWKRRTTNENYTRCA